jgi:hypothetical protein
MPSRMLSFRVSGFALRTWLNAQPQRGGFERQGRRISDLHRYPWPVEPAPGCAGISGAPNHLMLDRSLGQPVLRTSYQRYPP